MPRKSPYQIRLTAEEDQYLKARAAKYTLPYFQVIRAKMILLAAEGFDNDEIAQRLDSRREIVSPSSPEKSYFEQDCGKSRAGELSFQRVIFQKCV